MTTDEKLIIAERYNKTFKRVARALVITAFVDDMLLPLPVPRVFKPLHCVERVLSEYGKLRIDSFEKFKKTCEEEDRKMEEIKKDAIEID